jgi:hypothetical protein
MPDEQAPPPSRPTGPWSRLGALSARAKLVTGAITGLVALLVSITTLTDWIDQHTGGHQAPAKAEEQVFHSSSSEIGGARLERVGEPLKEYVLTRENRVGGVNPLAGYSKENLAETGLVFKFHVKLRGRRGEKVELFWTLFRGVPPTGRTLKPRYFTNANPKYFVSNRVDTDEQDSTVWVPFPPSRGTYYLTLRLVSARHDELSSADARFTLDRVPRV